jgi:hypothetical protein
MAALMSSEKGKRTADRPHRALSVRAMTRPRTGPTPSSALSRERFLLVKSGNAGLRASRNFNGLATGWTAADEPKSPFTC